MKKVKSFIFGVFRKIKHLIVPPKVTWPSFKDTVKRTGIVVSVSVVSALCIMCFDTLFALLTKLLFTVGM